jgi:hypothetical protein
METQLRRDQEKQESTGALNSQLEYILSIRRRLLHNEIVLLDNNDYNTTDAIAQTICAIRLTFNK